MVGVRTAPQKPPLQFIEAHCSSMVHAPPVVTSSEHVPVLPTISQRCVPVHADTQQIPFMQFPERHWGPPPQVAPVGCGVGVMVGVSVNVDVEVIVGVGDMVGVRVGVPVGTAVGTAMHWPSEPSTLQNSFTSHSATLQHT